MYVTVKFTYRDSVSQKNWMSRKRDYVGRQKSASHKNCNVELSVSQKKLA